MGSTAGSAHHIEADWGCRYIVVLGVLSCMDTDRTDDVDIHGPVDIWSNCGLTFKEVIRFFDGRRLSGRIPVFCL